MGRKAGSMVLTSAGATICLTEVAQHQLTAAVAALARAVEQLLPTAAFFLPGQPNPQHSQRLLCLCKVLPSTLFMQVLKIESFAFSLPAADYWHWSHFYEPWQIDLRLKSSFSSSRSPLPPGFHLGFSQIFWRQQQGLLCNASLSLTATCLSWF